MPVRFLDKRRWIFPHGGRNPSTMTIDGEATVKPKDTARIVGSRSSKARRAPTETKTCEPFL